jgi:hypothetical protein
MWPDVYETDVCSFTSLIGNVASNGTAAGGKSLRDAPLEAVDCFPPQFQGDFQLNQKISKNLLRGKEPLLISALRLARNQG